MMATRAEEGPHLPGAGERVLQGQGRWRLLPFLGPAFIACVAYVDPGNFATNIAAGSKFGFTLVWVIVASIAMATDLAEFLGAALGIQLLLGIPLFPAAVITGVITLLILGLQRYGFRPLEAVITAFVFVIGICYLGELYFAHPPLGTVAKHAVVPEFAGNESVLISVGIIGATVMPHVIYLHSSLTQQRIIPRSEQEARRIFHWTIPDVVIAMGLAGLVNMAMLYMAASTFHTHGRADVSDITTAYQTLTPLLGGAASIVFAISLLASGLSSSTVGTMAGQVIMQGFVGFTIPVWMRRLVTMIPAVIVAATGLNPTSTLVISQVVL